MDDLQLALAAARAGAVVVRDRAGRIRSPEFKAANDPVTEADRAAQGAIVAMLRAARPGDEIVAEEGDTGTAAAARRWLVDPLDGTVNFIAGIPHVAVSVALYDGERAEVGVVVDVFRGEEFVAVAGGGATCDGARLSVTDRPGLAGAVIATGFPYDHLTYDYTPPLRAVLGRAQGIRRLGAAALDFAWVAAGRLDGFWELGLAPWDVAAGLLLVREAGGRATTPAGDEAAPESRLMVVTNGRLHEELRSLIAGNMPDHLR